MEVIWTRVLNASRVRSAGLSMLINLFSSFDNNIMLVLLARQVWARYWNSTACSGELNKGDNNMFSILEPKGIKDRIQVCATSTQWTPNWKRMNFLHSGVVMPILWTLKALTPSTQIVMHMVDRVFVDNPPQSSNHCSSCNHTCKVVCSTTLHNTL